MSFLYKILRRKKRMKKKFFKKLSIYTMTAMLAFSTVPGTVQAHSGRTDASGGHHDNKNVSGLGSYHYHCGGHPAHLHSGGVCPYSSSATTSTTSEVSTTTSGGGMRGSFGGGAGSGSIIFAGGAADVSSTSQTTTATTSASNAIQLNAGSSVTISKDIIKIVQDVLNQKGYDCGSVDGIAGDKTKNAIKKFIDENHSDSTDNAIVNMVAEGLGIK